MTPVVVVRTVTFAPAFNSAWTTVALPARLARWSGVYWPMRVIAETFAPAYTSISVICASPRSAA